MIPNVSIAKLREIHTFKMETSRAFLSSLNARNFLLAFGKYEKHRVRKKVGKLDSYPFYCYFHDIVLLLPRDGIRLFSRQVCRPTEAVDQATQEDYLFTEKDANLT